MARVAFIGLGVMGFPMAGPSRRQGPRGHRLQPNGEPRRGLGGRARRRAAPRRRPRRPRAPRSSSPASATTTTCARVTTGPDGAFAALGARRRLRRPHHRLGRGRARARRRRGRARRRLRRRAGLGRPGRRRERRADGDVRRRARALRPRRAGDRRLCPRLPADGAGRRRPAHQDGQPDSASPACCRASPRASPSPSSAGLDGQAVLDVIGKGAAGSWQMENRGPTMLDGQVRLRLRRRLDAQGPRHLPRGGRAQRRRAAGDGADRPVLQGRAGAWAAAAGTPRA